MADTTKTVTELNIPASQLHDAIKVDANGHATVSNTELAKLLQTKLATNASINSTNNSAVSVGISIGT